MSYAYVKSGGTAGGGAVTYGTAQTGTFAALGAANYYDNINEAVNDSGLGADDFILVSDAHSHNYATDTQYAMPAEWTNAPLIVMSVSDTAINQYSRGAAESCTNDLDFGDMGSYFGLDLTSGDTVAFGGGQAVFVDCSIDINKSNEQYNFNQGSVVRLFDTDISITGAGSNNRIVCSRDSSFAMIGGSCDFDTGTISEIVNITGGSDTLFNGVDFSANTNAEYMVDYSPATGRGAGQIVFKDCQLPTGLTSLTQVDVSDHANSRVVISNCKSGSAGAGYQYYESCRGSTLEEDTSVYRSAEVDGQDLSFVISTGGKVNLGSPFMVRVPVFAELSSASSDTIKFHLLCSDTLTEADVHISMPYRDGTNNHTPNWFSSSPTDWLSPATLTTNTESWTGRTTENRYEIEIDTSGDPGDDGVHWVWIAITVPSTTVYICPKPERS